MQFPPFSCKSFWALKHRICGNSSGDHVNPATALPGTAVWIPDMRGAFAANLVLDDEDVWDECMSDGTLNGVDALSFVWRSELPAGNTRDKLVAACAARIPHMSRGPAGASATLLSASGGNPTVSKVSDVASAVLFSAFPEFNWEIDVQAELARLMVTTAKCASFDDKASNQMSRALYFRSYSGFLVVKLKATTSLPASEISRSPCSLE
jgi:hypothetical protein